MTPPPPPASPAAVAAFEHACPEIERAVVALALRFPAEVAQHGPAAPQVLSAGLGFLSQMLLAALTVNDVGLLAYQLQWAKDRLPHDGVQPAHLLHRLNLYASAVEAHLPPALAAEINGYVHWLIAEQTRLMAAPPPP